MSQLPQEDVERLKSRLRFWKRLALASITALAALLLAIGGLVIFALWSVHVEHDRAMAEIQRALEDSRKADEEWEQAQKRLEEVQRKLHEKLSKQ